MLAAGTVRCGRCESRCSPAPACAACSRSSPVSGLIRSPRAVEVYLRVRDRLPQIKAGTYEIPARASAAQVVRHLEQGAVILEQLTIVEGWTFAQLRRALEQHPRVAATLRGKSDAQIMVAIGHAGGFRKANSFRTPIGSRRVPRIVEILKLAYSKMERCSQQAWRDRACRPAPADCLQALTLASIVEKETGLPSERPQIAGVFIARLRKGMRLQSDPTVIYGSGLAISRRHPHA